MSSQFFRERSNSCEVLALPCYPWASREGLLPELSVSWMGTASQSVPAPFASLDLMRR